MKFFKRSLLSTPLVVVASACSSSEPGSDDFGYKGTGIAVSVAPLDLQGVADACYSFEIKNGLDQRVVARGRDLIPAEGEPELSGQHGDGGPEGLSGREANPLCSSRFGDGGGAISYVAPCDASPGAQNHTVRLWVNAVCQRGSLATDDCVPMYGYQNPCGNDGCVVNATCVEDSDVPIQFNFTIMASAKQGFFDIAVRFDEVFCSAKLDTCYPDGEPINLLFDDSGNEAHTAVAAIACTAGTEALTTYLYETTFQVTCGDDVYTLPLGGIDDEGNIELQGPYGQTLNGAVYFGTEALVNGGTGSNTSANKVFTNIAFVMPDGACKVEWLVVPSDSDECPSSLDGSNGYYSQVAGVAFNGNVAQGRCSTFELDDSDEVATVYLDSTGSAPYSGVLVEGTQAFAIPDCSVIADPAEPCDGLDNDGDNVVDEGNPDSDNDGTADCMDVETCDALDNDGDGQVDEGFDLDGNGVADCLENPCVTDDGRLWIGDGDGRLVAWDPATDTSTFVVQMDMVMLDIAWGNDGRLYGLSGDGSVRSIDLSTGISTFVGPLPGNGLVADAFNNLLASGGGVGVSAFNLNNSTVSTYFSGNNAFSAGDLTWFAGDLYMAGSDNVDSALFRADFASGQWVPAVVWEFPAVYGAATDADGNVWSVSGDVVISVDIPNGTASIAGNVTGISMAFGMSMRGESCQSDPE